MSKNVITILYAAKHNKGQSINFFVGKTIECFQENLILCQLHLKLFYH